jgi:hypothetical protein
VTVAGKPGVDIPKGTLGAIIRQAGLKSNKRIGVEKIQKAEGIMP